MGKPNQQKQKILTTGLLALAVALTGAAHTLRADEVADTQTWLNRQAEILRILETKVDRMDLPKLAMLENAVSETAGSMKTLGIGNLVTLNQFYSLNLKFHFSANLLKPGPATLRSKDSAPLFDELLDLSAKVAKARNFENELNRSTTVSAATFSKLYELMKQLSESPAVDEGLRKEMQDLVPDLGRAISTAKGGDQLRETMDACEAIYRKIEGLYRDFDRVEASSAAFNTIILIQGLNEFYADFVKLQITTASEVK